jgi:hypothetical protein
VTNGSSSPWGDGNINGKRKLTIDQGLATVVAAFILAAGGVVGILIGRASVSTTKHSVTAGATVFVTVTASPNTANGSSSPPLPPNVSVRRSTGSLPIKLTDTYGVDLDDNVSPNWLAHSGPAGSGAGGGSDLDYSLGSNAVIGLNFNADAAIEPSNAGYATCAEETAYTHNSILEGDLQKSVQAHEKICVRTDQNRYALLSVLSVSSAEIDFAATVWDPPFVTS